MADQDPPLPVQPYPLAEPPRESLTLEQTLRLVEDLRRQNVRTAEFERWGIKLSFDRDKGKRVDDGGWQE